VRATVLCYLIVLGLLVGPLLAYVLVGVLRQSLPPSWVLIPNPFSALFSALPLASGGGGPAGVVGQLGVVLGGGMRVDPMTGIARNLTRPLYHYSLALYATLSLALYLLATRLVRPTRRWRLRWREVGLALALFLILAAAVVGSFVATAGRYERADSLPTPTPAPLLLRREPPVGPVVIEQVVTVEVSPLPTPTPTPATE
jgi:hypothetical protein